MWEISRVPALSQTCAKNGTFWPSSAGVGRCVFLNTGRVTSTHEPSSSENQTKTTCDQEFSSYDCLGNSSSVCMACSSGAHTRTTPPEGSNLEATALLAKPRLNVFSVGTKNQAPWLVAWNSAACELVAPEFTGNMLC